MLTNPDFADSIALIESNKTKLQDLLNTISENPGEFGLKINTEKTKSMATTDSPVTMKCGDSIVEQIVEFRQLSISVKFRVKRAGSTAEDRASQ